jgi:hypothetical protein
MSDWQRCVDWFLAKYCRCRLRLDSCWCRWRTSAKGRRWWGLQVWRRQVGFVRGTRWPVGSSAGRLVAWIARWSRGRFLSRASKPRSIRYYVGAESWVEIGGGYTEFAGFPVGPCCRVHRTEGPKQIHNYLRTVTENWTADSGLKLNFLISMVNNDLLSCRFGCCTPLHRGASTGNANMCEFLVKEGDKSMLLTGLNLWCMLLYARIKGYPTAKTNTQPTDA